jgi:hypothetical protein
MAFRRRREKRRMEQLAREVGPILAETDHMTATAMAQALQREVAEGALKSDEELRGDLEQHSTEDIESLLHHHTNALRLITGPEVFAIAVRCIRESLPVPSFVRITAMRESSELPSSVEDVVEMVRRMKPMVAVLKERKNAT